jgi:biotin operon repressor
MSSLEIARKLGVGDGEVKMVIQMLKKQGLLPAE